MLWPTGVLQDEIQVAGDKQQDFLELDRRGSSCPTLFVWDGERYEFVADMLGAGVVGHWIGPNQRDIPRPVEWIKVPRQMIWEKQAVNNQPSTCHPEAGGSAPRDLTTFGSAACGQQDRGSVGDENDPPGRIITTGGRRVPRAGYAAAQDDIHAQLPLHGAAGRSRLPRSGSSAGGGSPCWPRRVSQRIFRVQSAVSRIQSCGQPRCQAFDWCMGRARPQFAARSAGARYFGDFALTQFQGFGKPHSLTLDLGEAIRWRPALAADAWRSRIFFREQHVCGLASRSAGNFSIRRGARRQRQVGARRWTTWDFQRAVRAP